MPNISKFVQEVLNKINNAQGRNIDKQTLEQILSFKDTDIEALTKCYKNDSASTALSYLPLSRLEQFIPELLVMLQDTNWPAAEGVSKILMSMGQKIIPEIKSIFETIDTLWHDGIIWSVISYWDESLVKQLESDLIQLINKWSFDSGPSAIVLLFNKGLLNSNDLSLLIKNNNAVLNTCIGVLKEFENWEHISLIKDILKDNINEKKE